VAVRQRKKLFIIFFPRGKNLHRARALSLRIEFLDDLGDAQQIVGRERRERLSHLLRAAEGALISRRRVNSDVMFLLN